MRHNLLCAALGLTLTASAAMPAAAQELLAGADGLVPVNDTPAFRAEALRGRGEQARSRERARPRSAHHHGQQQRPSGERP